MVNAGGMYAAEIGRMAGVRVPVIPFAHEYLVTQPFRERARRRSPADAARPRQPHLLPRGGRGTGHGRLRARERAVVLGRAPGRPHPAGLQRPPAGGGLAAVRGDRRQLLQARPRDGGRQGHPADQRPRGVHPRQRVLPGRDRRPRPLRGRRLLRPWAGRRRRDRQGDGGVDRRRRAVAGRVGDGHPPVRGAVPVAALHAGARQEVYETYYDIRYPGHERQAGRPLRTSSAYAWHRDHGAAFGEKSGWERVNWYESNAPAGDEACARAVGPAGTGPRRSAPRRSPPAPPRRCSTSRRSPSSRCPGPGRPSFLERLCDNRIAERGRPDHLHPDAQPAGRDRVRLHRHAGGARELPDRHRHRVRQPRRRVDPPPPAARRLGRAVATSPRAGPALRCGAPRRREILGPLTPDPLDFGYMRMREIAVGDVPVRALRVTFVGEAGLGAVLPHRVRRGPVARAVGGGPARTA